MAGHFWTQHDAFALKKEVFAEKPLAISWYLSLDKIFKKPYSRSTYTRHIIFGPKMVHFPQRKIFSEKPLI